MAETTVERLTAEQIASITDAEWKVILEDAQELLESGKGWDGSLELIAQLVNSKSKFNFNKHFNLGGYSARVGWYKEQTENREWNNHIVPFDTVGTFYDNSNEDCFGISDGSLTNNGGKRNQSIANDSDLHKDKELTIDYIENSITMESTMADFKSIEHIFYDEYDMDGTWLIKEALVGNVEASNLLADICKEHLEIANIIKDMLSSGLNLQELL